MDEADQAETNRERGFGPSATRRGEILFRHPKLDLTETADMEIWQKMNALANSIVGPMKDIDPRIEVVRALPGNRPKTKSKGMEGTRQEDLPHDYPLQSS